MIKKIPFMLRFSKHSVSFFSNLLVLGVVPHLQPELLIGRAKWLRP
jgi:hypothetical protein